MLLAIFPTLILLVTRSQPAPGRDDQKRSAAVFCMCGCGCGCVCVCVWVYVCVCVSLCGNNYQSCLGDFVFSALFSAYFDILYDKEQDILSLTLEGFGSRIASILRCLVVVH